ncbi:GNAT family N-acetyltransferase [Frigoribacterium salinisoli]
MSAPTVTTEPFDSPDAVRLRAAQRVEIDALYGADTEPGEKPTADSVPVFLVARDADGTAIGCGGLRLLPGGGAEIKRMYVAPGERGSGTAVALLQALEQEARARGVARLLLETGTEQHAAQRFYEREGYVPIEPFGPYVGEPTSLCYARTL